ncbi:cation-translocating P-type ATPase [Yinghuangia seranimata]|uniref:cation-translocating P-type ATPase n=1 Tax=Yinghuangia seranimata TaxID=408067 RepID=UPI00248B79EA|nr:cation-translocating P-type ATPase [Yinghuangia seranimata]MDI2124988.1 HAD-IC family P-type ATPase [Yinghuangia seranimata]
MRALDPEAEQETRMWWSGIASSMSGLVPERVTALGGAAKDAAGLLERGGTAVGRALRAVPADLVEAAAVLADAGAGRGRRRVWRRTGRAHIEVRGLIGHGERHERLTRELTSALRAVEGVHWAEVNAVLGQVVIELDEESVGVDAVLELVEQLEEAHGSSDEDFLGMRPQPPYETAPAAMAKASLVADCVGLAVAAARHVVPLGAFPVALRVPVVLAETEPRLRRMLEERIGKPHADTVLGVSSAVVHALTEGLGPLVLDAAQRMWQLAEIRARQAVWEEREDELVRGGKGLAPRIPERQPRPVPLPAGPVEVCGERTSLATVLGAAGLLAWTRDPGPAAMAILATAPKAAGMGREAFSARLGRDLACAGVVPMDGNALRVLDRVTTVLIESSVLCGARVRLLSAEPAEGRSEADVWGAAHTVLGDLAVPDLCQPGPWAANGWLLRRPAGAAEEGPDGTAGLALELHDADGLCHGRVRVGCELDPLADAFVAAARSGGRRLLLTEHVSAEELLPWADRTLPAAAAPADEVRKLQSGGEVVLVVASAADHALDAADVGVGVLPPGHRADQVCWSADLICGPGLEQAWRILSAVDEARRISTKSAHLSLGGSALGALIAAAGSRQSLAGLTTSPIYAAAFLAQLSSVKAARRLAARPLPTARVRGAWHALGARETLGILHPGRETSPAHFRSEQPSEPGGFGLDTMFDVARFAARTTRLDVAARESGRLLNAVREELRDPLTPVLALGTAASAAVGSTVDSALVGGVMAGNALVSGTQRVRAERALHSLLLTQKQTARRVTWAPPDRVHTQAPFFAGLDTATQDTVDADRLRVGDIIALGPADVVPADARLLVSGRLEVDEASLTGESAPVAKDPRATPGAELADRSCMVYQGTTVLAGSGYAVVVAVGALTEAGRAAELAGAATVPTGLEGHLATLTKAALPAVGIGGAAVTVLGLLRGVPVREALASGVAVAVAAVPEGLPLVATVAQSAAARRLSRYGVLTRSARVLEALGRVDVVCYDKTGTLTEGRLTVARVTALDHELEFDSPAGRHLLRTAARACPRPDGDRAAAHATDRTVQDAAKRHCAADDSWHLVAELPFETSRGYAASLGTDAGRPFLAVKGAPETVLARCAAAVALPPAGDGDAVRAPFDAVLLHTANELVRRLAGDGLRVLAVAEATPAEAPRPGHDVPALARDLTLLGFLAIADAPRDGAAETVKRLDDAGVRVTMITGDHPATAAAVAQELGIPRADEVATGSELDRLPEQSRIEKVAQTTVFARVSPEHKVRIVQDLQRAGRVVAMAGDGINDAAAIRLADVGIGLSTGGGAAGAAADLVFTDPDPTRILDALLEGRTLWRSVRDAVAILVGGNAGEVAFTLLGTALSGRAPLGTRQLLLVNLLTDMLPALAVALAPVRNPVPGEDPLADGPVTSELGRDLGGVLAVRGTATTLGAVSSWQIGRMTGLRTRAATMGLAALVGTQLGQTLITDWRSPLVLATVGISTAALVTVVQTPGVSHFFGCTPLGPVAWATVASCSTAATIAAAVAPRLLTDDEARADAS